MNEELKKDALIILEKSLNQIGYKVNEPINEEHQTMMNTLLKAMNNFASHCCRLQRINCMDSAKLRNVGSSYSIQIIDEESILNSELIVSEEN